MLGSNQRPLPCEGRLRCTAAYRQMPRKLINRGNNVIKTLVTCRQMPLNTAPTAATLLPLLSLVTHGGLVPIPYGDILRGHLYAQLVYCSHTTGG